MAIVKNPWLRNVTGSVAGMVAQGGTTRGTTILREKVIPRDADTALQRVQRVIMATAGVAYGKMAEIVDHSFEGYSGKAANMNRFRSLNANMLRQWVANKQNAGVDWGQTYDFTPLGTNWLALNNYIMSEGSLRRLPFSVEASEVLIPTGIPTTGFISGDNLTYAELIRFSGDGVSGVSYGLADSGVNAGDQITVCGIGQGKRVSLGGGTYGGIEVNPEFGYCRLIMTGKGGDNSKVAFTITGPEQGAVTGGTFNAADAHLLTQLNGWGLTLYVKEGYFYLRFYQPLNGAWNDLEMEAGCAILSRKVNDKWLRSPSTMIALQQTDVELRDHYMFDLSTAISKTVSNVMDPNGNDLYLNNAQD